MTVDRKPTPDEIEEALLAEVFLKERSAVLNELDRPTSLLQDALVMTPTAVMIAVEELVNWRLFSSPTWLADYEACLAIDRRLVDLGLQAKTPGGQKMSTVLGQQLCVDLIVVFAGRDDEFLVPRVLESHGLLTEEETDELYYRLCRSNSDDEQILRPVVQRAYRRQYQFRPPCFLNAIPKADG